MCAHCKQGTGLNPHFELKRGGEHRVSKENFFIIILKPLHFESKKLSASVVCLSVICLSHLYLNPFTCCVLL